MDTSGRWSRLGNVLDRNFRQFSCYLIEQGLRQIGHRITPRTNCSGHKLKSGVNGNLLFELYYLTLQIPFWFALRAKLLSGLHPARGTGPLAKHLFKHTIASFQCLIHVGLGVRVTHVGSFEVGGHLENPVLNQPPPVINEPL